MQLHYLQAPARAALLLATTLVLACNGSPTSTTTETTSGGTKKVSKKASPSPSAGASASAGPGGSAPSGTPNSASPGPNGSTAPGTSPAPSTSAAPSTTTSTAPSTSAAPSTATSSSPSSGSTNTPSSTAPSALAQAATPAPETLQVSTYAGEGTLGFTNGAAGVATFDSPGGLAVHKGTGDVYVADAGNHAIRKIAGGQVTTMIGTGEATSPQDTKTLNRPQGVAVMADGTLLIADTANHRIRKLRAAEAAKELTARELDFVVGGLASGFADGLTDTARMRGPTGIALTADEKFLWVVDTGNKCIRLVDLANDSIETIAGSAEESGSADGAGQIARFNNPTGCAAVGNDTLYVVDGLNGLVRKVVKTGNAITVSTVGATTFDVFTPSDVVAAGTDPETNGSLLVADTGTLSIKRLAAGQVDVYLPANEAGFAEGGTATAKFQTFGDMIVHPTGAILIADTANHRIRKLASP